MNRVPGSPGPADAVALTLAWLALWTALVALLLVLVVMGVVG
jgi:hypothetical protein